MYQVKKRDGKIVDFDLKKIIDAMTLAFQSQNKQINPQVMDFLALKVTADFDSKVKEGLIAVEDIQDSVESVLIRAGYDDVAKAYILYRRQREKLRNINNTVTAASIGADLILGMKDTTPPVIELWLDDEE